MILRFWHRLQFGSKVALVFGLVVALRLLFMVNIGLIDDEAYHWSWAKELSLSYFDHPGMIAWMEAISTGFLGEAAWTVRLPAFLCYLGTVVVAYQLAKEIFNSWVGCFTGLILFFSPIWGFGGFVASPEPPFMFFWTLGAFVFWRGYGAPEGFRWSRVRTWVVLGFIMGLGLNSKFIMAMLAFGFGVYLLLTPKKWRELFTPWPYVGILIATLLCLPIFIWNVNYEWPGFKYQFHDRHSGSGFAIGRWIEFFAAQWLIYSPVLFVLLMYALYFGFRHRRHLGYRFLLCLALPSFLVFYIQPLFAEYKPHWFGPGALFVVIIVGALLAPPRSLNIPQANFISQYRKPILALLAGTLIIINVMLYVPFVYPVLPKLARTLGGEAKWQSTFDLSNEFHGWTELGEYLQRRLREIHATEDRPAFLSSFRYETTAQTYWGTKQKTYQLSQDRSHYSVTQSPAEMTALLGLNTLFVTSEKYPANPMDHAHFDSCVPEVFKHYRVGELSRIFTIYYCKNFQGIIR